jgi:hypothetical protein
MIEKEVIGIDWRATIPWLDVGTQLQPRTLILWIQPQTEYFFCNFCAMKSFNGLGWTKIFVFTFWRNVPKIHCSILAKSTCKILREKIREFFCEISNSCFFLKVLNKKGKYCDQHVKIHRKDVHVCRTRNLGRFLQLWFAQIMSAITFYGKCVLLRKFQP